MEYKEPNIDPKLLKPYDPISTEAAINKLWDESGFFNPDVCIEKGIITEDAQPFSIVLPPPNVTGTLHIGHAAMLVIEDIMTRFARMRGYRTLWLPGTDHAAIATQSKVEKILEKEGIRKNDLGREEFLKKVDAFAQESHDTIVSQIKKMGASVDWSREAFTLDEKRNLAVRTAFKKMYDDGLIYRGHRIVNWDPKGQTVISDDEIVYEERKAKLYTFKYSHDFPISISTTRPETKVGDVAVAVHPDDTRYQEFIGKTYEVSDFCGVPLSIKIISDTNVEKNFGTGALGVTPAHSQIDAEMAEKNGLPTKPVINEFAKMTVGGENLMGKKTTEAREVIAEWLRQNGLMEKEEDITQNVSTAERTGAIIEPLPKLQWFINVNKPIAERDNKTLKELMLESVKSNSITIIPDRFERVYFNWIENLRDWCISRQIWYGHRIPVWYDKDGKEYLPKKITLLLARHGESDANEKNIFSGGGIDSPLTDLGRTEAHELGKELKNIKIHGILSSIMIRAKDTAEIVCDQIGFDKSKIKFIEELHEIKTKRDGQPKSEQFPDLNTLVRSGEGAETVGELQRRADVCLNEIKALPEGTYLVSGHNAFNACIEARVANLAGEDMIDFWTKIGITKNCSYREVTFLLPPDQDGLEQDPDTLDTWFSSGLWTFSTLGWPDKTKDFEIYHPTTILETGYDILFFWVARMILMSQYLLGEVPFKTVYLHGLVRDAQGRKMSKSLGNIIDPLDVAQKYGADAVRMSLIIGTGPGNDSKMSEDKIKAYKNFANKLWNITRFILSSTEEYEYNPNFVEFTETDRSLLVERNEIIQTITREMEEYKFYLAGDKIYQYTWARLADVLIEESKPIFAGSDTHEKNSRAQFLLDTLAKITITLHPFMPFVTEEIWSLLPLKDKNLLLVTPWHKL